MSERPALQKVLIDLAVLLVYLGVAAGMTWPLAARAGTHLLAGSGDTLFHYWNSWWARQALVTGQSPFRTPYLFHPTGVSLVSNNFAWLNIAEGLVLSPVVGELAAYNLSLLINLALCGFAAFLLTRDLTHDGGAAFLAGLIYQCWPARLSQLGHPNLISTQWIPLFILFLIRTVRRGRWQDGVLTGLFLALTGYTRWQQIIPATIAGGVYLLCTLPRGWASKRRQAMTLLLAGAAAALALAPPFLLLINQQLSTPANLLVEQDEQIKQTDLMAYLTPSYAHPVLGPLTQPAYERYYFDRRGAQPFAAYVGITALALALVGLMSARRAAFPWAAMALVLILLALGPVLRVGGQLYPAVPMPYRLAAKLWVVRLLRFPDRYNMFLALPVAVLAAYGAASVLTRARRRGRWAAVVGSCLLGAAVLFEYLVVPVPLDRSQVSQFYRQLADEPGDFAVLNLPLDERKSKLYMFAQVTHQRPILQGHVSRLPTGSYAYLDGHPWLRVLRQYSEMDPELTDVSRQLASLAEDDIRYIILHKTQVGADRLAHWRRYLLTAPRFEDEQIVGYATSPLADRDFTLARELAPGIGVIRVISSTDCLNPGQPFEVDVGWGTSASPGRDFGVELGLVSDDGVPSQTEVFPLSSGWPTGEWPANALAWGYYALRANASLAPGPYKVTLALVDEETGAPQGQDDLTGFPKLVRSRYTLAVPYVVGEVMVSLSPCAFDVPPGVTGVNTSFGDELRLLGYELRRDGGWLTLTLHWRAERRMETDYKIFVHVFDPATAMPVAQDDAMPHRWAYPTTFWGLREVVDDVIPISLQGAPAGAYGVAVGVYDPATTERLPVVNREGQLQPDGRLVLPGETIEVEEPGP